MVSAQQCKPTAKLWSNNRPPIFEQAFTNIDDILWKEVGFTTKLDYSEQSSWLLVLKYLDQLEKDQTSEAEPEGRTYTWILDKPYRWEEWAALKGCKASIKNAPPRQLEGT